jgi:hypothetical protein
VAAGKHICKSLFILDLKGFALTKMTEDTRAFVKGFASLASDNFPEWANAHTGLAAARAAACE